MAENNNRNQSGGQSSELDSRHDSNLGNQQGTTQTGAQNNGGQNVKERNDQYTDDLRDSGDRNSSNRKTES